MQNYYEIPVHHHFFPIRKNHEITMFFSGYPFNARGFPVRRFTVRRCEALLSRHLPSVTGWPTNGSIEPAIDSRDSQAAGPKKILIITFYSSKPWFNEVKPILIRLKYIIV